MARTCTPMLKVWASYPLEVEFLTLFAAKIDNKGTVLEHKPKTTAEVNKEMIEEEAYGGLGSSVDVKLLSKVNNLCSKCGEYRSCLGECENNIMNA